MNMNPSDEALITSHTEENVELKGLWQEHLKLKRELEKINRKPYLTPEDKTKKKQLQLNKLVGKTKIEQILSSYRA